MLRIRIATVLAAFALVTACSSPDPSGDKLGGDSQDQTGNDNSSNNTGNKSSTPSGSNSNAGSNTTTTTNPTTPTQTPTQTPAPTPAGDPTQCGAQQTFDGCMACCTGNNQNAMKVADDAYVACMCQNPGACSQQCGGSFCTNQQPDATCGQCLDQNDQSCGQQADNACNGDATCKAALACMMAAGCDQKQ